MHTVFRQIKNIVGEVDLYLENLEKVAALFELGIKDYFEDKFDSFEERCADIRKLETENDHLRTKIKKTLYTDLLIPDARGDVLGLVETLDDVLGVAEHVFVQLSIEKPLIYPFIKDDFISLAQAASRTVEELVVASRSFSVIPPGFRITSARSIFGNTRRTNSKRRSSAGLFPPMRSNPSAERFISGTSPREYHSLPTRRRMWVNVLRFMP